MEEIAFNIEELKTRIEFLDKFIALSLKRNSISNELQNLKTEVVNARDLMTSAHQLMLAEYAEFLEEYDSVMSEMRKKLIIVQENTLKEKRRKLKEARAEENKVQLLLSGGKPKCSSAVKLLGSNLGKLGHNKTPKIKISEYKDSPLVKRKLNPLPFQFSDFDVEITQQMFDKIPKYMCGRETLDQLNSFLQSVVIPSFNEKYQLMHKQRSVLKNLNDLELWKMYNEQAAYMPGRNFITQGDITRKLNKMLDKKTQNRLTMLRHIGILQEQRVKQTICYIWTANVV